MRGTAAVAPNRLLAAAEFTLVVCIPLDQPQTVKYSTFEFHFLFG
jgi:hypothetical protein